MLIDFRQPITRSGGWLFQMEGNYAIISSGKGMEDIIMARAAAISFKEFRMRYHTEAACREELFRQRFPEGFVCPKCGCKEFYAIRSRNICQCRSCRRQTSVTAGTIMHRTHLPLTVWFWAIYLCATDKRGISAVQLSRTLGISYDSAWHLLERIRKAMEQRDRHYQLSGIVEMDDYYVGGPSHNGKRGRGTDKIKAVAAISKTEDGIPLFVRMKVVDDFKGKTLQQIVDQCFAEHTKVECDGYHSYRSLENVALKYSLYEAGDLHWLHTAISNFKAFLLGTYHGRCVHLQSYMDEFCFRFNRRNTANQLFFRLTRAVATSCTLLC